MEMNDVLSVWLGVSCAAIFGEQCWTKNEQIVALGTSVLGLSNESTFDEVVQGFKEQYSELDSGLFSNQWILVEAILCSAFCEQSEYNYREELVKVIISMDGDSQSGLMNAIQMNMSSYLNADISEPSHNDSWAPPACSSCLEKDAALVSLAAKLNASDQIKQDMERRLSNEIDNEKASALELKNQVLDMDLVIISRDNVIAAKEAQICSLTVKMQDFSKIREQQDKCNDELKALQDEVDILRPRAERFDQSESQLDKLRNRLDEMGVIKQQLKSEQTAHEETHAKLLQVERDSDGLRKSLTQFEMYKLQHAEMSISLEDLQTRLKQQEQVIIQLRQDNTLLNGDQSIHSTQTQQLSMELKETAEKLREVERFGGIGDCMSELNPVLMEELARLRSENEDLRKIQDATSVEALAALEKTNTDQQYVNKSLQAKWTATKDSLASSLSQVSCLTSELAALRAEYQAYQTSQQEKMCQYQQELRGAHSENERNIRNLHIRGTAMAWLLQQGRDCVVKELQAALEQSKDLVLAQAHVIDELQLSRNELNKVIDTKIEELEDVSQKRKRESSEHEDSIESLRVQSHNDMENVKRQSQLQITLIVDEQSALLAEEVERSRSIQADLEDEKQKRRRVEREKKLYEAEVHRHKTQLASGNSFSATSGADVEAAIKEFKSMQQQLEVAHAEIAVLREKTHSSSSSAAHASSSNNTAPACSSDPINQSCDGTGAVKASGAVRCLGGSRPQRIAGGNSLDVTCSTPLVPTGGGSSVSHSSSSNSSGNASSSSAAFSNFLEQSDMSDRRVEQLVRERREMLAKSLEESKERGELGQKLLMCEKEIQALKSKVTKMTLEKERADRLQAKQGITTSNDNENTDINVRSSRR